MTLHEIFATIWHMLIGRVEGPLTMRLVLQPAVASFLALRAEPIGVNLKDNKVDPLLEFAQCLEDLDSDKPYEFDLRIMASENRLDLPLTVLDPKSGKSAPENRAPSR